MTPLTQMKKNIFQTSSPNETEAVAQAVAKMLQPGDVIGLSGELGGGKTTFVRGLAKGLGLEKGYIVSSPTFTWIHEYRCQKGMLYHIDLYRLENPDDIHSLDLSCCFEKGAISVIEWFEKARDALPKEMLEFTFETINLNHRRITLSSENRRSTELSKLMVF